MANYSGKIYFASDLHLGMHPGNESREREKRFVSWLEFVEKDMTELWLLGDIFDYWFEYKKVVPKGHIRFLGKLAELADQGVGIHMFSGNHDVWLFDYLPQEIGATIHHSPTVKDFGQHRFFLAHGDGLNKSDRGYLILRSMFRSRFLQWCYARLHPNGATAFAQWWSRKSRYDKVLIHPFEGEDKEDQVIFARNLIKKQGDIDYFLFGHRHMPFEVDLGKGKRVMGLGDWITHFTYAVYDGTELRLEKFE